MHWLSLTMWTGMDYGLKLWDEWFAKYLGSMIPTGHGGRGFKYLFNGLVGSKLYARPIGQKGVDDPYFHLELPGSACEAIEAHLIQEFVVTTDRLEKANFTRLDLAWDGVGFRPLDVKQAIEEKKFRSYLKRKTLKYTVEPLEQKADGNQGTTSLRVGALSSERLIRVYDKRGPVRLELQLRAKRADVVTRSVLKELPVKWPEKAMGHLRDYVDFQDENGMLLTWWGKFVNSIARSRTKVTDARQKELEQMTDWLMTKVSPTYSAVVDVVGRDMMDAMLKYGKDQRGRRFDAILELSKEIGENDGV